MAEEKIEELSKEQLAEKLKIALESWPLQPWTYMASQGWELTQP